MEQAYSEKEQVSLNKQDAQKRVDQILAFRNELSALHADGAVQLSDAEQQAITVYHERLLEEFSLKHDADLTTSEYQLSWGMRIASTLGAIAFTLGVFMFFEYYWDTFATLTQVVLVTTAPALGWLLSEIVARAYKTPHYTLLAVLTAIACFAANLYVVGSIYNVTPTPYEVMAWGLFGLLLAFRHDLPLVGGPSLLAVMVSAGGLLTNHAGFAWPMEIIPEFYIVAGILCLLVPMILKWPAIERYRHVVFFVALLQTYFFLQWLMISPEDSLLPLTKSEAEWFYTVVTLIAGGLAVRHCIHVEWAAGTYLSALSLVMAMLQRYFDWFYDDLPNYVFFLLLGVIAIGVIVLLRRTRALLRSVGS